MAARSISTTLLRTGAATVAMRRISEFFIVRSVAITRFPHAQSTNVGTATRGLPLSPSSHYIDRPYSCLSIGPQWRGRDHAAVSEPTTPTITGGLRCLRLSPPDVRETMDPHDYGSRP